MSHSLVITIYIQQSMPRQVVRSQPRILTHDTSGANTTILYVSDRKEVHVRQKTA